MFAKNKLFYCAFVLVILISCNTEKTQNPLQEVLRSEAPEIKKVINSLSQHEIQILFTQIDRDSQGTPLFTDYEFQVNSDNYFYPASSVKFPIAVLALEKLNREKKFTSDTRFFIEGDSLETTFKDEVLKIFAVSDNEAYNRLFEFLGTDYINTNLHEKGLQPVRISHRLSAPNANDVHTKPIILYENDTTITQINSIANREPVSLSLRNTRKGKAFYQGDSLVTEPFDFSLKNHLPLRTLHNTLKRVIFPEAFNQNEQFSLNQSDRDFLLNAMHTLPAAAGYDPSTYYDSYGKFFIFGDDKENIPDYIKIYNKVGYAYGTLTDCAYIKDSRNNIEFMLSATILVNKDQVFNDNAYEYDDTGIPFLAELGRQLYAMELKRVK
ncbi:serine hydrolase [Ascidiimonas aurantiaca]|uniref:serine hydrolase n=1 Tax=Ascidiimonas aurantiaca TaxID=1685432 RepID=UPI0030EF1553